MAKKHTYILGLNTYDHDVSACLLRDGEIAFAIAKERITREKHASGFHKEVVDYCLDAEGITLADVDLIVRNCYILPVEEMERRLVYQDMPGFLDENERIQAANSDPLFRARSDKVVTISHHLAHAYSAFAVVSLRRRRGDGRGRRRQLQLRRHRALSRRPAASTRSRASRRATIASAGTTLETLKKVWLQPSRGFLSDEFFNMPGLGALYSRASTYIFGDWNKCGELMGLAPYGRPGQSTAADGASTNGELHVPDWSDDFTQPWLLDSGRKWEASPSMRHWEDLAWQVQDDTETVLLARARWLRETTGAKNLCIAGGVALNCVANGRIAREAGFENVWIQPAAGDDGIAIGCAYYGHLALQKKPRAFVMSHAYRRRRLQRRRHRATPPTVPSSVSKPMRTPAQGHLRARPRKLLAERQRRRLVPGPFRVRPARARQSQHPGRPAQGRDEGHPQQRASSTASRSGPFAPIVLAERADGDLRGRATTCPSCCSPSTCAPSGATGSRPSCTSTAPRACRPCGQETTTCCYRLLKEFDALTGVPVLINTSFNVKGEPIVETPTMPSPASSPPASTISRCTTC